MFPIERRGRGANEVCRRQVFFSSEKISSSFLFFRSCVYVHIRQQEASARARAPRSGYYQGGLWLVFSLVVFSLVRGLGIIKAVYG